MFKKIFIGLEANIRKYFFILFTWRRNFLPILSVYYLSLPNTNAQQIWFYTAIWFAISFLFQIPAWIIGDKLGNKTTIIIAKLCLLLSSIMYIVWDHFIYFVLWSALMWLGGDAFSTWNTSMFLHDTLTALKKEHFFKKISSSIRGWVSFLSVFFIVTLPFFTSISLNFPFKVALIIDIIWLIVALSLYPVKTTYETHQTISFTNIKHTLQEAKWTLLFPIMLFSAMIWAFLTVDSWFRMPYLTSLWYPIMYAGFVMWGSRLVRFIVWQYAQKIDTLIPFRQLLLIEILLFSGYYFLSARLNNPYIIGITFALVIWYFYGRSEIYTYHIINLIPGKKYKSTILSIKGQISWIIQIIVMFCIGFVMNTSYKLWFLILWCVLFLWLSSVYIFLIKNNKNYIAL